MMFDGIFLSVFDMIGALMESQLFGLLYLFILKELQRAYHQKIIFPPANP
jgi:hypothetical protein